MVGRTTAGVMHAASGNVETNGVGSEIRVGIDDRLAERARTTIVRVRYLERIRPRRCEGNEQ